MSLTLFVTQQPHIEEEVTFTGLSFRTLLDLTTTFIPLSEFKALQGRIFASAVIGQKPN